MLCSTIAAMKTGLAATSIEQGFLTGVRIGVGRGAEGAGKGLKLKCNPAGEMFTLPAEMETSRGRGNVLDEQSASCSGCICFKWSWV